MRAWLGWLAGGLFVATCGLVSAHPPYVRVLSVGDRSLEPVPDTAVFAHRPQKLSLGLFGYPGASGTLVADLFQAGGSLAIPLVKNIKLEENLTLAESTAVSISLTFPNVQRPTDILARFAMIPANGAAPRIPLGELRFEVFPESLTKELTDLLSPAPDGTAVVVFGPGSNFRRFLAAAKVRFDDAGDDTPSNFEPTLLYLGDITADDQFQQVQDRWALGGRVVVFSLDESLPPGVYTDRAHSGALIHITAPLLENLSDDPRAQNGLIKILHLVTSPTPQ